MQLYPHGMVLDLVAPSPSAPRSQADGQCGCQQGLAQRLPHVVQELRAADLITALDALFRSKSHTAQLLSILDEALAPQLNRLR